MDERTRNTLTSVQRSESSHVVFLQGFLSGLGAKPVQPCRYNFSTPDAAAVVGTAAVLEAVGKSAYLGAAPAVGDKKLLGFAASIVTVESAHEASIRGLLQGRDPVPVAFDSALSSRAVFTLAQPFIASCPDGSNLPLSAFPALRLRPGQDPNALRPGTRVRLDSDGALFVPFSDADGCQIPEGVAGVTYLFQTNAMPPDGAVTDAIVVAGPMAFVAS